MMLLWSSRELRARNQPLAGQAIELSGMLILAMPGIVLATGFFLLLNNTVGLPDSADGIVIFTNALMAVPYALKVLETPMRDITARYSILCESLGLSGFNRLKVVEFPYAAVLSLPANRRLPQPGWRGHRVDFAAALLPAVHRY